MHPHNGYEKQARQSMHPVLVRPNLPPGQPVAFNRNQRPTQMYTSSIEASNNGTLSNPLVGLGRTVNDEIQYNQPQTPIHSQPRRNGRVSEITHISETHHRDPVFDNFPQFNVQPSRNEGQDNFVLPETKNMREEISKLEKQLEEVNSKLNKKKDTADFLKKADSQTMAKSMIIDSNSKTYESIFDLYSNRKKDNHANGNALNGPENQARVRNSMTIMSQSEAPFFQKKEPEYLSKTSDSFTSSDLADTAPSTFDFKKPQRESIPITTAASSHQYKA